MMDGPLELFHPLIRQWFVQRYGAPTEVQARSWPEIAAGNHVLITAPTGTGKTLTAFLWALNQLLVGRWEAGRVRVLYVSPLKALNNDIQRNLLEPLAELREVFGAACRAVPDIRVLTRSGDTPQSERRWMLSHPPEILITTPESLNIMLASRTARGLFADLTTIILDEIHSVAGSKRGTHLITAVDRLVPLAGEFQRVALSATVDPLETVADFIGGYVIEERDGHVEYGKRPVTIVRAGSEKEYAIRVRFPEDARDRAEGSWWPALVREFKRIIGRNRSTLLFANSRRLCERVSLMINEGEEKPLAYSHHGSLSHETRLVVEERLKRGELAAIVATTSLEMGIDIGALDEVVLIETPPSVSSAVQRVGRAGHNVGEVSRGTLFPLHGRDFLDAAVVGRSIINQDIETTRPVANPLDVLAQVIVSMAATEVWDIDKLYDFLRASYPYRHLDRTHFDLVVNMLAGRYAQTRLRELRPLVSVDRIDNTVRGRENAARTVYMSGGTIPDRGYFNLRLSDSNARIGDLDEEFVWERSVGDTFTLGTQTWKIQQITHSDVLVAPGDRTAPQAPFWRAEAINRDSHLSARIAEFLEWADPLLDDPQFPAGLQDEYCMSEAAAAELIAFLHQQKAVTRAELPHRHHLLIEHSSGAMHKAGATHTILHTLWGGTVNQPFALALAAAWEKKYGNPLQVIANNDAIALLLPGDFTATELLSLVSGWDVGALLRQKLEQSGFFGARFRENAARALLLTRSSWKRRMPLWLNRLRSKKLLNTISRYEDFPILAETWRTCLRDEFDVEELVRLLDELRSGEIKVTEAETIEASPFAQDLVWGLTNQYMYMDDTPELRAASRLTDDLLKELVFSPDVRPEIPTKLIRTFQEKLQRIAPGYAPRTPLELLDWVKERLLIPEPEWAGLQRAIEREGAGPLAEVIEAAAEKLVKVDLPGAAWPAVVARENLPPLLDALEREEADVRFGSVMTGERLALRLAEMPRIERPEEAEETDPLADWLGEWLQFYGPVGRSFIERAIGVGGDRLQDALETLVDAQSVVVDRLSAGAAQREICDSENLERLLRLTRAAARPAFEALGAEHLPLFLAAHQGITNRGGSVEDLQRSLEQLFGYPAPAELWEKEILPARLAPYSTAWVDSLMQQSDLVWLGCGTKKITLCFSYNLDLFTDDAGHPEGHKRLDEAIRAMMPDPAGRYSFETLARRTNGASADLAKVLWDAAWEGEVTNDSFAVLRSAIASRFNVADIVRQRRRGAARRGRVRRGFASWKATRPFAGNWYILQKPEGPGDALEKDELNKDRVRVLLDRYGILSREVVARELPGLRWGGIFRALRLMELSGEILAGHFFEGIAGLQFISHAAWRRLQEPLADDAVFWLNAADPASLCGSGLEGFRSELPARLPTTHLVYCGAQLVVISKKNGKDLEIRAAPDDARLPQYFSVFNDLLNREFRPAGSITIETINGEPAHTSPYLKIFRECFDLSVDYKGLKLWKTF